MPSTSSPVLRSVRSPLCRSHSHYHYSPPIPSILLPLDAPRPCESNGSTFVLIGAAVGELWPNGVTAPYPRPAPLNAFTVQITQPFELYLALDPDMDKANVVNAANIVARWVKREEGRLFLRDAPVF